MKDVVQFLSALDWTKATMGPVVWEFPELPEPPYFALQVVHDGKVSLIMVEKANMMELVEKKAA